MPSVQNLIINSLFFFFFKESLAFQHWKLGFWNLLNKWVSFKTTSFEGRAHPWHKYAMGIPQIFKLSLTWKFWTQSSRVINSHANMHFPAFLFSLEHSTDPIYSIPQLYVQLLLFSMRLCSEEASMMDNRSPLTYCVIYHITASILLTGPSPYVTVSSCATPMHQKEKFEYEAL